MATADVTQKLIKEIYQTPQEYRPMLLRIVESFRQSVTLPSAEESFRQGWQEILAGEARSIADLWEDIDTD